jgi:hypothetical protein
MSVWHVIHRNQLPTKLIDIFLVLAHLVGERDNILIVVFTDR